jgi:hypothetical protein
MAVEGHHLWNHDGIAQTWLRVNLADSGYTTQFMGNVAAAG